MSLDISKTIAPKSDQLNADDLIGGPRTITITAIRLAAEDQPVSIHFEGDEGKPYKPCKSMRRVLVKAWGADGAQYSGRSMTLYLDESVRFGGAAVGGIRISHLSHISKSLTMALTATRATKKAYTVGVLATAPERSSESEPQEPTQTMPEADVEAHQIAMHKATSPDSLRSAWSVAYKAACAIRDQAALKTLQDFYNVRKKTLAEAEQAA